MHTPRDLAATPPYSALLRALGWIVVLLIVLAWGIDSLTLLDPDEAHYAAITREMLEAREWFVPLLDGQPFIDKPVLFHWLQALSFRLFGETEWAARLPSVSAALGLVAITWWMGRRLFGAEAGERAALMLATIPATFALSSIGVFDMLFTSFLFGSLACLAIAALEARKFLEWCGYLLLALAVLTKGPVALVLIGLTFAICLALPSVRPLARRLRWIRGLGLVLAIALPWFVWMWWTFGPAFVERYILYGNIWLFSRPLYRSRLDTLFYARTFMFAFLPWSLLALGHLADVVRSRARNLPAHEILLWTWIAVVIGFFTFSRFKLDTYIYPAAPAVCLIAAVAWQRLRERAVSQRGETRQDDGTRALAIPVLGARAGLAAIPVILLLLGIGVWAFLFEIGLPISRAAVLLPIALVAGSLVFGLMLLRARFVPSRFGLPLIATLVASYGIVAALGFPVLEAIRPTPEIARWLTERMEPDDRLAVYELGKWRASLRFYTNRPVAQLELPEEALEFFEASGRGYAVMKGRDAARLREWDPELQVVHERRGVVQSERGRIVRRQRWAPIVVVTKERKNAALP